MAKLFNIATLRPVNKSSFFSTHNSKMSSVTSSFLLSNCDKYDKILSFVKCLLYSSVKVHVQLLEKC